MSPDFISGNGDIVFLGYWNRQGLGAVDAQRVRSSAIYCPFLHKTIRQTGVRTKPDERLIALLQTELRRPYL